MKARSPKNWTNFREAGLKKSAFLIISCASNVTLCDLRQLNPFFEGDQVTKCDRITF